MKYTNLFGQYGKYILTEVSVGNDKYYVLRGDFKCDYHKDILADIVAKCEHNYPNKVVNVECLGGGKFKKDDINNIIQLWGQSVDFGKEPRNISLELLKSAYPTFLIEESEPDDIFF
jgi:hypothetical protein